MRRWARLGANDEGGGTRVLDKGPFADETRAWCGDGRVLGERGTHGSVGGALVDRPRGAGGTVLQPLGRNVCGISACFFGVFVLARAALQPARDPRRSAGEPQHL